MPVIEFKMSLSSEIFINVDKELMKTRDFFAFDNRKLMKVDLFVLFKIDIELQIARRMSLEDPLSIVSFNSEST